MKPFEVTLTREKIKVERQVETARRAATVICGSPSSGKTAPDVVRHLEKLAKADQEARAPASGSCARLRNDPGGLLSGAVGVSAACHRRPGHLDRQPHRDAKRRYLASGRLPARPQDDFMKTCRLAGPRPWWCCQCRFGLGLENRRRRAAGPQAGRRDGHPDLRQGFGANRAAAVQQCRDQLTTALFRPRAARLGQGHHADIIVEGASGGSRERIREADLERHLGNDKRRPRSRLRRNPDQSDRRQTRRRGRVAARDDCLAEGLSAGAGRESAQSLADHQAEAGRRR